MVVDVKNGQLDSLLSGRLLSFASAWQMFRDRPVTGMGPGTFGWHYFGYKLQLIDSGKLTDTTFSTLFNFEETHNDHLEVLSETGAVGYLIFAAALVYLASRSFRRRSDEDVETDRARFARLFAFPFAAAFAVVALAQYPMQLAASTAIYLFLIAMTVSWSETDEAS